MTDLNELERLLRYSTPGPWDAEGNSVRSLQPWSASGLVATTSMAPDMQDAEDNAALIAALRNCAEELIRDARRYRWLRGDGAADYSKRWTQWEVRCWQAPQWTLDLRRSELDAALDDAIAQEQP